MINVKALAPLIPLLLAAEPSWEKVVEKRGVVVSKKQRKGSVINEVRATGVFDAPPHEVWKVLADLERYPEFMPYTAEVSVLERSDDGRTQVAYERLDIPFAAQRDYLLVVRDESTPEFLKLAWRCA